MKYNLILGDLTEKGYKKRKLKILLSNLDKELAERMYLIAIH